MFKRSSIKLFKPREDKLIYVADKLPKRQRSIYRSIPAIKTKHTHIKAPIHQGIGIISDTPIYSEFIRLSLQVLEVDIKYYGHPKHFNRCTNETNDTVSAWIIFLSDDADSPSLDRFLDQFLDRYMHQPTLFLCAETNIVKTSEKINHFVAETGLFNLPRSLISTEDLAYT